MDLYQELCAKREKANLSQRDLAQKLGMASAQLISNWERGKCEPPVKKLAAISKILDIKFDHLVDNVMEMKNRRARLKAMSGYKPKAR